MTNEELQQEVKRLEEQIKNLKVKLEEKKPYEVEVPTDIEYYLTNTPLGREVLLMNYLQEYRGDIYIRGLAFENRGKLEQYDKERILLFKLHKWAEEHNAEWTPNWEDFENKYFVNYDHKEGTFSIACAWSFNHFSKLPYFKSEEIAKQFIEEFGDEIKEVFC